MTISLQGGVVNDPLYLGKEKSQKCQKEKNMVKKQTHIIINILTWYNNLTHEYIY
jgi:hypothetical protein